MGEMADYYLDLSYDYYDSVYEEESEDFIPPQRGITCRLCDEKGLHWKIVNSKWRLFNYMDRFHFCEVKPLKE